MSEFVLYEDKEGNVKLSVLFSEETFWLNQNALSNLFEVTKQTISYHLNNIFTEGELDENSVVKEILTTATDGKKTELNVYG